MKTTRVALLTAIFTAAAFGLCTAAMAATDADKPRNYVQGHFGALILGDDLDDADFDSGLNGGVSYGRYLSEHFKIEGMFDYNYADRSNSHTPGEGEYYSQDDYLSISALLVTLKGEVAMGPVDFFAGAGGGIYGVWLYSDIDSNRHGSVDDDDYDTVFGAHVSLGANYNITNYFFIGLEGRYRWTGEVDLEENVAGYPLAYSGNLNGYSVAMNIGFRF